MKCPRCGYEIKDEWKFCPNCGLRKGGDPMDAFGRDLFSQLFGRMKNSFSDFDDFDRMFEKNFQAIDLSPLIRKVSENAREKPKTRGFTVRIKTGTGMQPKIDIRTQGDVKPEMVEKEIERRFGFRPSLKKAVQKIPSIRGGAPKVTEEPQADVKRIGDRIIVDIKLPEVKSEENIDVKELSSSVEVKAAAGEKAYFKIITKPENFRLTQKSFSNGTLHLEFL